MVGRTAYNAGVLARVDVDEDTVHVDHVMDPVCGRGSSERGIFGPRLERDRCRRIRAGNRANVHGVGVRGSFLRSDVQILEEWERVTEDPGTGSVSVVPEGASGGASFTLPAELVRKAPDVDSGFRFDVILSTDADPSITTPFISSCPTEQDVYLPLYRS